VSHFGWIRRRASALASGGAGLAGRTRQLAASPAARIASAIPGRHRGITLTSASAALVLSAGVIIAVSSSASSHVSAASVADRSLAGQRNTTAKTAARKAKAAAALRVVSVTPASGNHDANGGAPIKVVFTTALAAGSPMPRLSPSVKGSWKISGGTAVFTPSSGYGPGTHVTVTVPSGTSGIHSASGGTLASATTDRYTTGSYSTLGLQQLLARLGYLPLTWTASSAGSSSAGSSTSSSAAAQLSVAYQPPAGTFAWQPGYPRLLTSFWKQGSDNLVDTGAIRAFESDAGLTMDGVAGPSVWAALLKAAAVGKNNTHGYTYAIASKGSPENLTIWHNGRQVLHNLANTGIPAAPTADGTFPVYLRYYYQVMKGTNPDGSKYADPVWYVAYFNGGDAVHYFDRYSYGFQQSLGCVELPWNAAKAAWPYLTYGSLVTVEG
jgi:peptidoglycan hydrolase-like protein with peptidoglycan-binding domain